jgi:YbbR domain-containing protein
VPEVEGIGSGLTADVGVETVEVTLNGPLPLINSLTADDLKLTLDVSGLGVGIHEVTPQISLPDGVIVSSLRPETVSVTLTSG